MEKFIKIWYNYKVQRHAIHTAYGEAEVMFGRLFSPKEEIDEKAIEGYGFPKDLVSGAKRLYCISKLFQVVDNWPTTCRYDENEKLKIVTKIVNMLVAQKTF